MGFICLVIQVSAMKRDHDYMRNLLAEMEASDETQFIGFSDEDELNGDDRRHYHFQLMADAGYVAPTGHGYFRLTSKGHDFVEATRSNKVWRRTKATVAKAGGMTLEMVFQTALTYLKEELTRTG